MTYTDDEREALEELRKAAEAQAAAYDRMLEIGRGVGGLGDRHPEMVAAMIAWDARSTNGHADTVLSLIGLIERNRGPIRPEGITDEMVKAALSAWQWHSVGPAGMRAALEAAFSVQEQS